MAPHKDADKDSQDGKMGNDFSKGVDSAVSIITGIITGDMTGGLAGASAPWLAEQIKIQAGDNETARLVAHAILGAVVAELQGNSALSGGAGAVVGEVAADIIRKQLYGKEVKDLTEEEKQTISALSQLASGLAVAAGGGNIGDASAAISSSKNAVENNTETMDWWREKHKRSTEYTKGKLRETLGENTISQIINGALTAYGDTVDLGAGAADTVLDGLLALSSCAVGVNYCDTALNNLRKADQTVANAVNAIINGQAWDAIKDNFVKAANGDQIALENSAALLIGIITPTKGLGNVGKTEKLINKSDKVISDANKAGKLDEALSDANKLDKEYFENQYGKNNVEQGFGDYKEIKDNINNNHAANQQANKNSNFDEHVVNEKGLGNAGKGTTGNNSLLANANKELDQYVASLGDSKYKPATAIGAVDPLTGKVVTASSGTVPTKIAPELQAYADKLGGLGVKTSCGNVLGACAEFRAANELLLNNPNLKLKDIQFTQAVRPRNGKPVPRCENCTNIFGVEK